MRKTLLVIATAAFLAATVTSASATTMKKSLIYMGVLCSKESASIACTVAGQNSYTVAMGPGRMLIESNRTLKPVFSRIEPAGALGNPGYETANKLIGNGAYCAKLIGSGIGCVPLTGTGFGFAISKTHIFVENLATRKLVFLRYTTG